MTHVYNPWSIVNFLEDKEFKAYWVNSSSNDLVSKLIQEGNWEIKSSFGDLLLGKTISTRIIEDIAFNQLNRTSKAVWSLLLASRYLSVEGPESILMEHNLRVTAKRQI